MADETFLAHIGILRRSGRYPWGSGKTPHQRNRTFLETVEKHMRPLNAGGDGLSATEVATMYEMSTTTLRALKTIAKTEQRQAAVSQALRLKEEGNSNVAIGKIMGIGESSVRSLLDPSLQAKNDILAATSSMLRDSVAERGMVQIGSGIESHLGISKEKLATAVSMLEEEGYATHNIQVDQLTTGKKTLVKVLAPPGTTYVDVVKNPDQINLPKMVGKYSEDGGRSFVSITDTPTAISAKRLAVRYKEDGGDQADGVIYLRPGVDDISLGGARYVQTRIAVEGTHYLKGMAMYRDDLPAGVDILFNTNKPRGTPVLGDKDNSVLKPMKDDKDLPFGSVVRQSHYIDPKTGKKKLSAINIVNDENDWEDWSRNLSSQMLSKQKPELAKQQLAMTFENKKAQYDEIMSLTNPAVKRKLLEEFADSADSSAVHLKAAALPAQKTHVILPFSSLKEHEIYAPNYADGTPVVLVRYPHGGIFEIPELTVNNRSRKIKEIIGNATAAVGIHPKVAEKLSGADFDGDTVLVIPNRPNGPRTVQSMKSLKDLEGFDPKTSYPGFTGMKKMTQTQREMGSISNLITDMTIKNAQWPEIARAVKHSMVVIDAEKHGLNYKQSAKDNGIAELKAKYQERADGKPGGASTIISRASAEQRLAQRKLRPMSQGGPVDPTTGEKVYVYSGETYIRKTTNKRTGLATEKTIVKPNREASSKMAETKDAHSLVSKNGGTVMEKIYADHANRLKALANTARKETLNITSTPYSPSAKAAYAKEVASLSRSLLEAQKNAPLERQAQLLGGAIVKAKQDATPGMSASELKKVRGRALLDARNAVEAKKQRVEISDSEWKAIQAGAITNNKLTEILKHADPARVKELALPRQNTVMTKTMTTRAKSMLSLGYTQAEVAAQLGIPVSTITSAMSREG